MKSTGIASVSGRRVWDSRGRPTVEAEIALDCGAHGRAIAPAGASTGSGEATDLRDGGLRLGGFDVRRAVANVNEPIASALRGLDASDQELVDGRLIELAGSTDKAALGANATLAVSMAAAHAAAAAAEQPLWLHLLQDGAPCLPLPEIQIFGGGAHAGNRIDIQDFMVVPLGAASIDQALEWTAEVYYAAGALLSEEGRLYGVADEGGYWPAFDTNEDGLRLLTRAIERAGRRPVEEIAIALDVAASQFGKGGRYVLAREARELDSDGLATLLLEWSACYPIVSLEDPMSEDDHRGMCRFTAAAAEQGIQVVGDDYLVTDAERIRRSGEERSATCALIKPNQRGTLSEARGAVEAARACGLSTIVSARSGETEDVTIAHLAVGWGVKQLKVGSITRSERTAKWNELVRIGDRIGPDAAFAGERPS